MGSNSVRRIFIGLAVASTLTAGTAVGADSAQATISRVCQVVNAPLVNNLCVTAADGRVSGDFLYIGSGTLTVDALFLGACNAANTSCTEVPGSRTTSTRTPSLPATPGQNYKSCIIYHLSFNGLNNQSYSGCTPLVTA